MLLEKIKSLAAQSAAENIQIRRHLHAHPELSYQEFETCKFVQAQLKASRYVFSHFLRGRKELFVMRQSFVCS